MLFIGLTFPLRIYLTWKTTGTKPFFFGKLGTIEGLVARLIPLGVLSCLAIPLVNSYWPSVYASFGPIIFLEHSSIGWLGILFLITSLTWIVVAQNQMGRAFRMGVNPNQKTVLVNSGLFRYSRNPIYLGMAFTLIGLFLVLPSATALGLLISGVFLMNVQIKLEENLLIQKHGQTYQRYIADVPRWL
jgi:protein-S-isoprenylcysteine O-methyltransferase Ste14